MPCLLILENAPSAEVRHASLREGLRRMLGVPVEVIYDTLGKPSLVGDTPLRYLSVTTTGSYMVAALAVDAERRFGERRDRFTPDRTARLLAAANRFFTAADAAFVRADPRRFQSRLRKPQQLVYLNCFHVVFLLLEPLFDCAVDLALNEVFLQAQIRHDQRQNAQHCRCRCAVHILGAVCTTEKLPDEQYQRVFRRLL